MALFVGAELLSSDSRYFVCAEGSLVSLSDGYYYSPNQLTTCVSDIHNAVKPILALNQRYLLSQTSTSIFSPAAPVSSALNSCTVTNFVMSSLLITFSLNTAVVPGAKR